MIELSKRDRVSDRVIETSKRLRVIKVSYRNVIELSKCDRIIET